MQKQQTKGRSRERKKIKKLLCRVRECENKSSMTPKHVGPGLGPSIATYVSTVNVSLLLLASY